ncbi:hypothetical protein HETIRDRAFT_117369 [Heterobasidion irregulare TC 32-1]|uniref:Fungal STAND N-terminal Goodbye domain-containing protein n=1 Tax=Heterobasidion irregulare (strain TC 32-1) TaxID=747525 RepID=W4K113_HETIT|nr:uncharacterized protein HETIRDRAFT_117369 [Heterobasidion irregulare TC 32-1]ETW79404.1 hypothetical protein HETIRDRAFT_117369 [Heterobasidion irregulare TC 32-1]
MALWIEEESESTHSGSVGGKRVYMTASESNAQFAAIWASALEEYKRNTNKDPTLTPLEGDSPDVLLAIIDEKQLREKSSEKLSSAYWSWNLCSLRRPGKAQHWRVLRVLRQSLTFLLSKAIFVAIRILLGAAKNVTAKYDAILDVFGEMGDFLDRLRIHLQQGITAPMRNIFVEIISQMLRTFGIFTKSMKRNRLSEQFDGAFKGLHGDTLLAHYFRGVFDMDDNVKGALEKLRVLSNQELQMATTVTLVNTTEIVNRLQDEFEIKIRAWLSLPDPFTNYNTASHTRSLT